MTEKGVKGRGMTENRGKGEERLRMEGKIEK